MNEKADNLLIMRIDFPNDSSSRTRWDLDGRTLPSVKGKGTKYIRTHPSKPVKILTPSFSSAWLFSDLFPAVVEIRRCMYCFRRPVGVMFDTIGKRLFLLSTRV